MKHEAVDVKELTRCLKRAAGSKSPSEIAKSAKVEVSRVSKFLNGDFKKLTPPLSRLCASLGVKADEYLITAPPLKLSPEILGSLRKIIGRDARKMAAAAKLFRNLELLAANRSSGRG